MRTLNKNRPFATVHGEGEIPHVYEQDGYYFDAQGKECGRDPTYKPKAEKADPSREPSTRELQLEREAEEAKAAAAAASSAAAAKEAEVEALRAQLAKLNAEKSGGTGEPPKGDSGQAGGVDEQLRAAAIEKYSDLSKDELHKHLKKVKVKFESDANKDRLVELAVEHELKK